MKPFKGVISAWRHDGEIVRGICTYHSDMEMHLTAHAVIHDKIVRGEKIQTSKVLNIEDRGAFSLLETKDSFYALVEPQAVRVAR